MEAAEDELSYVPFTAGAGAGEVMRMSPLRMMLSLTSLECLILCVADKKKGRNTHCTFGAQASPTVVRGSMRDHVATVVSPTA